MIQAAALITALVIGGTAMPVAADPTSAELFLARGSRLMIDAKINGRVTRALLDSAAEATLIDPRFAQSIGLVNGQSVTGRGSGKETFKATLVEGVSLEALGLHLQNQTVAITDLQDVGRRLLGRPIDVILGRELFDAARLRIDIEGRKISVVSREIPAGGVALPLTTEHGVETLPARVENGPPLHATFDLGNGSQVLISKDYAERMHLLSDGRKVTLEHGGGLGGSSARQIIRLRSIEIAGVHFDEVDAAVDPQDSASDLNVGVSILRRFLITVDYSQHRLWLEPLKPVVESPNLSPPPAAH
jgi:predicted aspartyl protease